MVSNDIESSGVLNDCDRLLRNATHIVFLGFGYDPVNIQRLQFSQHKDAEFHGTVFGLEASEVEITVRRYFSDTGISLHNSPADVDCLAFLRRHRNIFL